VSSSIITSSIVVQGLGSLTFKARTFVHGCIGCSWEVHGVGLPDCPVSVVKNDHQVVVTLSLHIGLGVSRWIHHPNFWAHSFNLSACYKTVLRSMLLPSKLRVVMLTLRALSRWWWLVCLVVLAIYQWLSQSDTLFIAGLRRHSSDCYVGLLSRIFCRGRWRQHWVRHVWQIHHGITSMQHFTFSISLAVLVLLELSRVAGQ